MKQFSKRMLKVALTLCMIAGQFTTLAFAQTTDEETPKNYVSLGDSMTNGYGLDGYYYNKVNVWGFLQEAPNAYPSKVAEHYGWNLTQLALSGFRAEEVHYLLEYGSENAYPGDDYTHRAGLQRFDDDDIKENWPDYAGIENMSKLFQNSIKEADVVSIQLGTNNFGTFMTQRLCWHLTNMTGFGFGGNYYETNLEEQMNLVSPEAADFGMKLYDGLLSILTNQLNKNGVSEQSLIDFCISLTDAAIYSTIGFVNSYKGIIDWIDANSEAEVIAVAMPNSLDGMLIEVPVGESGESTTLDLGVFFGYLVNAANAYIAGLPAVYDIESTYNSESNHNVKVYYADPGSLELLITQIATGNFEGYSVLEDKIVGNVTSTIFPLLEGAINDVISNYGLKLETKLTTQNVANYKNFAQEWAEYTADSENRTEPETELTNNLIFSSAIYLAIEDAIVESAKLEALDVNSLSALINNHLDSVFESIQNALNPDDIVNMDIVTKAVMDHLPVETMNELVAELFKDADVNEFKNERQEFYNKQLEDKDSDVTKAVAEYIKATGANTHEAIKAVITSLVQKDVIEKYPDKLFEVVLNNEDAKAVVSRYASRYAAAGVTEVLANALKDNDTIMGLFHLFARYMIGDGIGCHPSTNGHQVVTDAIINAYDNKYTAKDETIDNITVTLEALGELIKKYGPEVAEQIWAQWEEYGYVEAVETTIDELETLVNERYAYYTETALPAINDSIQAMLTQKDALTVELDALKVELAAKKAELAEVIAKQEIGSIYVPEINIDAELGGNEQTVVPGHDCVVTEETIEAELNAAIADLEHAIAVIEALLSDIEADLADMIVLAEQIADAVAELEKTAQSIVEAGKDLSNAIEDIAEVLKNSDGVVEAVKSSLDAAYTTAQAAADVLNLTVNTANELVADINSMITIIAEDAEKLYNKFIKDLPGCIDQIPEEALLIIGGSIMMVEKALEENKEEIKAVLAEELKKLAEQYDVDVNEVQNAIDELTALYNADEEEIKAKLTALAAEYGITEESIRAELDKVKAQISEEVNAKYSVIEAEMNAKIEELKTEANNKLDALNAELEGLYTELNNAIEEDKAVIQAQIDRVLGDIQVVSEDLECAVSHLEEAAQIAYEEIVAEVTEVYETVIAELNAKLEELKEAYDKAVEELNNELAALKEVFEQKVEELKAKLEELKKAYDKAVEDLTAAADKAIEELIAEANKQLEALGKLGEALNEALNGIYDAIREELTNTQLAIEAILKGQLEAVKDLAEALGEIALDSINEIIDTLTEQINALLEKVTTDDLVLVNHDDYVALGDSSAVSESYVDSFADEIEKEYGITLDVTNLAGDTQTLENAVEVITSNAQTIAEAELITLGYGNNAFADAALNNMYDTLRTGSSNSCDWAGLVGAEAVPYIEEALSAIKADLVEAGLDVKVPISAMDKATLATALMVAIETYAYETVAYTVSLPSVIAAIRELNSEAVVIVVGMYNPFRGTTLTYDNVSIELGDYVDVLVEAANLYATGLCMMTQDAIFVEASDADTDLSNQTIDVFEFIITYFYEKTLDLNPNETGHAYITAQLLEALNIKLDYLLGDVNLNGRIDIQDPAMAYAIYNGIFEASKLQLIVSDVDGNGKVDVKDPAMIYAKYNGVLETFPAENK